MTLGRKLQQRILCAPSFHSLIAFKNINNNAITKTSTITRQIFTNESTTKTKSWFSINNNPQPEKSKKKINDQETIQLFTIDPNFTPNIDKLLQDLNESSKWHQDRDKVDFNFCRNVITDYYQYIVQSSPNEKVIRDPDVISMVLSTLLKTKLHTNNLSSHLRILERLIGNSSDKIVMTDGLSYRLLEVHGKAGNIGRCLSLLEFRKKYKYIPRDKEFLYAIQSIISAALPLRTSYPRITKRDVLPREDKKENEYLTQVENPTRWLDAILINMKERNFELNDGIANKMLSCFANSGRSGRGLHWFYQTKSSNNDTKVQLKFNAPPSSSKLPSSYLLPKNNEIIPQQKLLKAELHTDKILQASILFAKSLLTGGVCGHTIPIKLTTHSYNVLIKSCCHRGAFAHAFDILHKMKLNDTTAPDAVTYNTILSSLARVGDVTLVQHLLHEMASKTAISTTTSKTIYPLLHKYTSQAVCDAYLNTSDIHGAITQIQNLYNTYHILPPYTTHYKVLEFSLGVGDVYEAKRYVWFLQHVWKYSEFVHKKIGKEELKHLFKYFGAELVNDDFYVWNSFCEHHGKNEF